MTCPQLSRGPREVFHEVDKKNGRTCQSSPLGLELLFIHQRPCIGASSSLLPSAWGPLRPYFLGSSPHPIHTTRTVGAGASCAHHAPPLSASCGIIDEPTLAPDLIPCEGFDGFFLGFFFSLRHYVWVWSSSVTPFPCKFDLGDSEGRGWPVADPWPELPWPSH